jgi:SP family myo-inositol transporter-like MFS transporter 13
LKYIDIVGRRRIMMFSAPGMVFGLTLASIAFHCMFSNYCTMGQIV